MNALDERVRQGFISASIPTEPVDELLEAFPGPSGGSIGRYSALGGRESCRGERWVGSLPGDSRQDMQCRLSHNMRGDNALVSLSGKGDESMGASSQFIPVPAWILLVLIILPWLCRAVVVAIALRGTQPKERPAILRAVAECFRWRAPTRDQSNAQISSLARRRRVERPPNSDGGRAAADLDVVRPRASGEN